MCNITKKLSFLVKILYNVNLTNKTINCISLQLLEACPVSSVARSNI